MIGTTTILMLRYCIPSTQLMARQRSSVRRSHETMLGLRSSCANYDVFGPMGIPGQDLVTQRWPVTVRNPTTSDGKPDIADVIYGIHLCTHAHGEELPNGFELLPDAAGPDRVTRMQIENGRIRLSDRVIFGLLATAVMCHVNTVQRVPNGYFFKCTGEETLLINDWWGRKADFLELVSRYPLPPCVNMDFGVWMAEIG